MATILVVEDNLDIQDLLAEVLRPQATVIQALNGVQGLHEFRTAMIDLVILDLMLPGVTGESVLKQIRKTSNIPVLVLTAVQDKEHIVSVLNEGANDYLTKPFDLDELVARVNVQLRHLQRDNFADGAEKLVVSELCLDPKMHTVTISGRILDLPKKEFALLAVLMKHPHQVFSKSALYEQVWQEPYLDSENTLNVHLSNLRTKLNEFESKQVYITTIWGIGVRLL
ncbi:response regulator transcription factor [Lapidilactobacillus bayanensis]|uniref:response regulator transcription factor n=1 Tax=Lapidilactobacillus bayanensis TaxID=2485998 RepID=UPI000F78E73B|nr:response regulator transcription factor [Lapidilactobacillus bayanensis]